jgi:uncharacterized protein (TIGR01244 family)
MSDFRKVTDRLSVSPQISVEDVARAAREGFGLIINNRPDGEAPDQPSGAEIAAAAEAAGVDYLYVPINGRPSLEQAQAVKAAIDRAGGPTLAFCRSGTRSITTWAIGEAASGGDSGEIIGAAAGAGYDLRPILG